ncbi:hypothetical protein L2E82_33983 [Cichorium intybus]|uniref:Uncharacterized protein n=1 Tax=Cichorium intybus TaxID=13427 RepID=A0ACB9BLI1_CICIN|nr:hypothetical protein L2E82_33983 [Cichorium intybus]
MASFDSRVQGSYEHLQPLFPGESGVDQLVEIIKIFHNLVSCLLQYSPKLRCTATMGPRIGLQTTTIKLY